MKKYVQSNLKILIFDQIYKWVNCAVEKYHYNSKFVVHTIKINVVTKIVHEIVNLIVGPKDDETRSNNEKGFYSVLSCPLKCIGQVSAYDNI